MTRIIVTFLKELAWAFSSPLLLAARDYAVAPEPSLNLKEVVCGCASWRGQKQPQLRSYSAAAPLHLKSKEYKDRNMWAVSFDVILNTMLEMIPNITISEMKKINTFKGQFRKENRKFTNNVLRNIQNEK